MAPVAVLILLILISLAFGFFRGLRVPRRSLICANCGSRTEGKTVTPGSLFIELVSRFSETPTLR